MRDEILYDDRLTVIIDSCEQAILVAFYVENRLAFHAVGIAPGLPHFVEALPLRPPRNCDPGGD